MKTLHPGGRWVYPDVVVRCGERLDRKPGGEGGIWQSRCLSGLEAVVRINTLGVALPLAGIYDAIPFPPPAEASAAQAQVEAASDSSTMAAKP